jgi:NUMOD4 motif
VNTVTDSEEQPGPYWSGKTAMEIRNAVDVRAERWAAIPGYSRYEWSDKGRVRVLGRTDDRGRRLAARVLKTRVNNAGYEITGVVSDAAGKQVTVAVAPMVVLAHHPAFRGLDRFPGGLETRHGKAGPLCNAYPENLWPGTKKENADDKDAPPAPQHECRNHALCGNLVHTPGRRCVPCTQAVGREAARLLAGGANLMAVTEHFGYSGPDWVYKLAVRHGGYGGSKAEALAQHPGMVQRVRLRAAGLRLTQGGSSR